MKRPPSVSLQRATERPGVPRGTRKQEVPLVMPAPGLVVAYTTYSFESQALVMNCLRPLMTHLPFLNSALVCIIASGTSYGSQRSEAPRGSVRQCESRKVGSFTTCGNHFSWRWRGATLRNSTETFQIWTSFSASPQSPREISSEITAKLWVSVFGSSG